MKKLITRSILSILAVIFFTKISFSTSINSYIDNVIPKQNEVSANRSGDILITFAQSMNAASINNANIKMFGYQTGLLPVTISYNSTTKTATIDPHHDLKYGEVISVTLTDRIKTSVNESILPFVYTFRVHAIGGNGVFTRFSAIDSISNAMLVSGDIDGDRDIDLVVNNKIYRNNGYGEFSFFSELSINGIPELADFDSDGDLDILIELSRKIYFYQNVGFGVFVYAYFINGWVGAYGDLDGDGFFDVAYINADNDNLVTLKNNNGILESDTLLHMISGCGIGYRDKVLIDDMNNDGNLDMVGVIGDIGGGIGPVLPFLCRYYNLITNTVGGVISTNIIHSQTIQGATIIFNFRGTKTFDYNGDGYVDILSPGIQLRNNTNGTFSNTEGFYGFSWSIASDFNGDSFIDLVKSINYASLVPLYTHLNDGNGNFAQFISNIDSRIVASTAADLDNDGDIDMAGFDNHLHEISILLNGDVPSPVELSSFTSVINNIDVILRWTTSIEENNSGFDIERTTFNTQLSMYNDEWENIGFVNGNGNSSIPINYEFTDINLASGKYKYRLKQIDFNGNYEYYELSNEVVIGIPEKYSLSQNYPNPFNPVTNLEFGIALASRSGNLGFASLKVYDISGKEIATLVRKVLDAGYYNIIFDGSNFSSGIYFYSLEVDGNIVDTKRMVLLK